MKSYDLIPATPKTPPAIHCRMCGRTSYSQGDVETLYCAACKLFHEMIDDWIEIARRWRKATYIWGFTFVLNFGTCAWYIVNANIFAGLCATALTVFCYHYLMLAYTSHKRTRRFLELK